MTTITLNTAESAKLDPSHALFNRTWDRLQKIVKRHKLTVNEDSPYKYSTFGNGFHLWTGKKWVTASSYIKWRQLSNGIDEYPVYIGQIKFEKR